MGNYFNLLKSTLDDLQLHNLPAQTWNLDETSLSIEPSKTKVVGGKGAVCSRVTSGPGGKRTWQFPQESVQQESKLHLISFSRENMSGTVDGE